MEDPSASAPRVASPMLLTRNPVVARVPEWGTSHCDEDPFVRCLPDPPAGGAK